MAERAKDIVNVDELKSLLSYDPQTGVFKWAKPPRRSVGIGSVAGSDDGRGYTVIGLFGRQYRAHRLAWLYMHGVLPDGEIDHINRVRNDNRIANLRIATSSQQKMNKFQTQQSGYPGVYLERRSKTCPYKSQVRYRDPLTGRSVLKHLGVFKDAAEAHEVYDLACQLVHGEFYRGRA
jgi:hypothetical protein